MKRKFLLLTMALVLFSAYAPAAGAETEEQAGYVVEEKPITVTYNGDDIVFPDALPLIQADRTLVPVRAILERAKLTVDFDPETRIVTADKEDFSVSMPIDGTEATVTKGGVSETVTLEAPAVIIDDRTYVPIRFIAESLGTKVNWNPNYREVVIIDTEEWKAEIARGSDYLAMLLDTPLKKPAQTADATGSYILSYVIKNKHLSEAATAKITVDYTSSQIFDGTNTATRLNLAADLTELDKIAFSEGSSEVMEAYGKNYTIDLDMVADKDWNLYIKSQGIQQILRDSGQGRIADNIGDNYVKLSLRELLSSVLHLSADMDELLAKSNTVGELLENFILADDLLYSQSVLTIDSALSRYIGMYSNDFFNVTETEDGATRRVFKLTKDAYLDALLKALPEAGEHYEAQVEELNREHENLELTMTMDIEMKDGITTKSETTYVYTAADQPTDSAEEGTMDTRIEASTATAVRPFDAGMDEAIRIPENVVLLDDILGFSLSDYLNLLLIG